MFDFLSFFHCFAMGIVKKGLLTIFVEKKVSAFKQNTTTEYENQKEGFIVFLSFFFFFLVFITKTIKIELTDEERLIFACADGDITEVKRLINWTQCQRNLQIRTFSCVARLLPKPN